MNETWMDIQMYGHPWSLLSTFRDIKKNIVTWKEMEGER